MGCSKTEAFTLCKENSWNLFLFQSQMTLKFYFKINKE